MAWSDLQRKCSCCKKYYFLTSEFFPPRKECSNGLRTQCRICIREKARKLYKIRIQDPEQKRKKRKQGAADYYRHITKRRAARKIYDQKRNRSAETMNRYYQDSQYRNIHNLRSRLRHAFRQYSTTGKVWSCKQYGIDFNAIIKHLGPCPGKREDYHIDHIIPCIKFNHNDIQQIKQCWAPENFQWLTKEENLSKGGKYVD